MHKLAWACLAYLGLFCALAVLLGHLLRGKR